ncbi:MULTISPECIES: GGDEF domain-containing protein [unclassified Clostridium]|uniref:GGDEF domain-containing protein n=1 Tax=unclassified Clostridium TaxID=2614128 RepID=UPI00029803D2|nr:MULTISPECIES: GGDEF domain-containing protein [unclassified Clostridium]EKQ53795.1 MAG: diguanylate cyclase (GGDEF) domain-containing protein [Clostridium sp. Maddingley MBC34-26]
MNELHFFYKQNPNLRKDQKSSIIQDIFITNFVRMKLLLGIFIIVEILFIIFNDIPYLFNPSKNIIWNDSRFFILHLLILFVSIIGLIMIKISTKNSPDKLKNTYKLLIPVLTILLLSLMAIINGLDQLKPGNISSVFIANLIIFSAVIIFRFPLNLVVYSIPFLTYLYGLLKFQHNTELLISNIINGSIFFLAVILISTLIYNYHYEKTAKNILLEETNSKLNYMSSHDPLTGLLNRRSFGTQVSEKMKSIAKTEELAGLILIDIDYYKYINDKFGHPIGDIVLKEVSNILTEHIKATDLVTRWGGEEFLIFLFQTSINEAYSLAENLRLAIENKVVLADECKIQVTASFGVSLLKDNSPNSFDISYKAADAALYKAKNQGRNQVILSSDIEKK